VAALIPDGKYRILMCKEMFIRREKWSGLSSWTSGDIYSSWKQL